ncbi:MAG: phosphoribosyltransferase regulatory subunit [Myxococcaceae bacterium]|nr:phosphoribosyltransferase regulatory subunit [Myxococcaceae bacterium]
MTSPRDVEKPEALEHPLPAGMRDLLPEEASRRRALAAKLMECFALRGYAIVTPPAFEFAAVLERGLGDLDPRDVLRFVEPESGEVAALRPDVTPQIARMIATRMQNRHAPWRLAYEATVLRRRSGRARKSRQIPQVGIELAGAPGFDGDVEVLRLATEGLAAAGLDRFTIDLGDASIVRSLLDGASDSVVARATAALGRKDADELALCAAEEVAPHVALLAELVQVQGGRDAILEGARLTKGTAAEAGVLRLLDVFDAAVVATRGTSGQVSADLGEVRGFAYYTGTIFHAYAEGPGEPLGSGGRYDELLARFGTPMPAVGFAFDLHALEWARRSAGLEAAHEEARERVVVVGAPDDPRATALRARGIVAVTVRNAEEARAYAASWGFTRVLARGQSI